ncbi:MAG: enolase C-terminal domain-like protein [Dehalococcoidia bacterium]
MKITGITAHEVGIPMQGTLLWAYSFSQHGYTEHVAIATPRTIIEVHTDDGLTGIGEVKSSKAHMEGPVADAVKGGDPFNWKVLLANAPLEDRQDKPGFEYAMWDLMGKFLGRPAAALVNGGHYTRSVEFAAYVFFRAPGIVGDGQGNGEVNLENHPQHVKELVDRYGFRSVKLKIGVYRPQDEIEDVKRVREAVGPDVRLRIDPNSAWDLETAIWAANELRDYGIEYLEDVARGLEAQAKLRAATDIPVCVDGSYSLDRLANVVRLDAGEIAMCDIYGSGGIAGVRDWATMAKAFGLKTSMHSGRYLGVSHMAKVHAAAAAGPFDYPIDAHYHQQSDDVLVGGLLPYGPNGTMTVPDKPGLGIDLDYDRLEKYRYTDERKAEYARFHQDLYETHGHLGYGDFDLYQAEHVKAGGSH